MRCVIGLDIGGTNLRIGLVREGILERAAVFSTPETFAEGDEIRALGRLISDFRGKDEADSVSVGFPSPVGPDEKTVLNAPNIIKKDGSHAFSGKNVADPLSSLLGVRVLVNNDANHLLCFDAHTAKAGGVTVGCYIGTGFGAAAMINGRLLQGKNGCAMEAGHIPFYRSDRLCGCGKVGCAECHASGRAAREMLESRYPGKSFAEVFKEHGSDEPVTDLIQAIAITTATLVNLFDPHILFLGGGTLSEDFPKERLKNEILKNTLAPYPREGLDIRFSRHDAYSGVMGAAYNALNTETG
ncbi:MAG: ROK family protein [Oscillospiraceae bacterium]|nr:ROK family protein [Oscillospiraceae bacterium]